MPKLDNADLILKYKKLLDEGIITQEEFDKKKKELL
ncbi:MAG: SHOCT domain-containing protein [Clostridia bacterium]|nr:SHOCT domain-containing protein [Clostridia bacterium]